MKVIGLTGGIGAGKSTASAYLKEKGCYIIDADKISREMTAKGGEALGSIRKNFGDSVFFDDGQLDRKKLGEIVFSDTEKLKLLESITTEIVVKKTLSEIERLRREGFYGIIVLDAPLLFECGLQDYTDDNWLVIADPEIRIERIKARDGLSRELILDRIDSQMSDDEKKRIADKILDNSGSVQDLCKQIDSLV